MSGPGNGWSGKIRKRRTHVRTPESTRRILVGIPMVLVLAWVLAAPPASAQMMDRVTVEDFVDQTADILDRARDVVQESGSLQARRVLEEAERMHGRSGRMLDQGRRDMAMTTSRHSRAAALHAMRLAREALVFSERYQVLEERMNRRRSVLGDRAQGREATRATELLGQAGRLTERAREKFHQGDARQAVRLLDQCGALLDRAAGMLGQADPTDTLDEILRWTGDMLDRVAETLAAEDDPVTGKRLDEARNALDRARNLQARGLPGQALQAGRIARGLAERALLGPALGADPRGAAERQIERWDDRMEALSGLGQMPLEAQQMLSRARNQRLEAGRLLTGKQDRKSVV